MHRYATRIFILFLFLHCSATGAAQSPLDSLREALLAHPQMDSARCALLTNTALLMLTYASRDSSEFYALQAWELAEKLKNPTLQFNAFMIRGVVKAAAGDEAAGIDNFIKALEFLDKHPLPNAPYFKASALINLGGIYFQQTNYSKALSFLRQAISILELLEPSPRLADAYRSAAIQHKYLLQYDSARLLFLKALDIYTALDATRPQNLTKVALADLAAEEEQWQEAYSKALTLQPYFEEIGEVGQLARLNFILGKAALGLNQYPKSYAYLRNALKQSRAVTDPRTERSTIQALSHYFRVIGRYDSAYHYAQIAHESELESLNEQKATTIERLEVQYQTNVKEKENEALRQENQKIRLRNLLYLLLFAGSILAALTIAFFLNMLRTRNRYIEQQNRQLGQLNEQVASALEHSRKLSQEKKHLVSLLSHDLRTPLEIIQLNASLLEADMENPPAELWEIRENARRIHEFSLRIMAAENIEDQDIPLHLLPVSLQDTVSAIRRRFASLAAQRTVTVNWLPDAEADTVLADPFFLEESLANIISNALKFAPARSTITLSSRIEEGLLCISVHDEGPGSPLFTNELNPFVQPMASSADGTGQGLYLTQRYVQLMGGYLRARTLPEGGAEIELFFRQVN